VNVVPTTTPFRPLPATALGAEGLVVASWVENKFANESSILTDDPDVLVGH
jgi:hypothetical protein